MIALRDTIAGRLKGTFGGPVASGAGEEQISGKRKGELSNEAKTLFPPDASRYGTFPGFGDSRSGASRTSEERGESEGLLDHRSRECNQGGYRRKIERHQWRLQAQ